MLLALLLIVSVVYQDKVMADAYSSYIVDEKASEVVVDVDISIEALEKSLAIMEQSDYSRSTTLRNIARLYMVEKNWDKAADVFQEALRGKGLSDVIQQEMLYQLIQVLMQSKKFDVLASVCEQWLGSGVEANAKIYLTLAAAYAEINQPQKAEKAVVKARKLSNGFNELPYKYFLKIYYKLARYDLAAEIVKMHLNKQTDDEEAWALLSSIYIAAKDQRSALATLEIAHRKKLLENKDTIYRMTQLYMFNKLPVKAAELLEKYQRQGVVIADAQYYETLYQAWSNAREVKLAKTALVKAAELKKDGLLYLHLAQMQIDLQEWESAITSTYQACKNDLHKRHFGKAFLFRGISQFNLHQVNRSKHSFINATRIGTEREAAAKWLRFIGGNTESIRARSSDIATCG